MKNIKNNQLSACIILLLFNSCHYSVDDATLPASGITKVEVVRASTVLNTKNGIILDPVSVYKYYLDKIEPANELSIPSSQPGIFSYQTTINSGKRQFLFSKYNVSNKKDSLLTEKTIDFTPNADLSIYLADEQIKGTVPEIPKFRWVVEDNSEPAQQGKTGVRFVNLSPDINQVKVMLGKKNATFTELTTLQFAVPTSYYFYSEQDGVSNDAIPLRFTYNAGQSYLSSSIPASSGKNFVIYITGFLHSQQKVSSTGTIYNYDPNLEINMRVIKQK